MGKGCYPIFAIMSHHCICNARYFVDPRTFNMYVRARVAIKAGEEITVQYLSALNGTHRWPGQAIAMEVLEQCYLPRRRRRIRDEWFFDCLCARCSDPSERGTNISGVKCSRCAAGVLLPAQPLHHAAPWLCNKVRRGAGSVRSSSLYPRDNLCVSAGTGRTVIPWRGS